MANYSAEDLPAYLFAPAKDRRPMTDETAAMSGPCHVAQKTTEEGARAALVGYLERISGLRTVVTADESGLYRAAAREIAGGKNMVRVYGRVYRLRDLDLCTRRELYHGLCEVCTPATWTVYDSSKKGSS